MKRRSSNGDGLEADAFARLFDAHARAVHAFCARRTADLALADDLTSIVFLEAWRSRRRNDIATSDNPLPWLLGVANNVVRNDLRARLRYRAALRRLPLPAVVPSCEEEVAARAVIEEGLAEALHAIARIPHQERDVVALVLWSGLSYEEAARALGVPVGTVRSRLSRARSRLQSSMSLPTLLAKELP